METKILPIVLISVLALLWIAPAFGSYALSFPYTAFNQLTPIAWEKTDKTYDAFTVEITNHLIYNPSTNGFALVRLQNNTNTNPYFEIAFDRVGNKLTVYVSYNGTDNVKIAEGTYELGKPVYVSYNNGYLTVKANNTFIVKDFGYGDFQLAYIGAHGGTNTATGGYIQVQINKGMTDITSVVYSWIPLIVTFAMLGIVLSFLKKF